MAKRKSKKSLGAYKHDPGKVLKATIGGRSRHSSVSVITYRTASRPGEYRSHACIRGKGIVQDGIGGKTGNSARSKQSARGRCASGYGKSPTKSVANALYTLAHTLK